MNRLNSLTLRQSVRPLLATLFLLACADGAHAASDAYSTSTQTLTIPSLAIGTATYSLSITGITLADVVSVGTGTPNGTGDTYTPPPGGSGAGTLFIPSVVVNGGKTYNNVTVRVQPPPATSINITSLTGVDVLTGPLTDFTLQSASVQVGSAIFVDVTLVHLTVSDVVTPPQGGLPNYVRDQYFAPNLYVPVVFAGNHVYTNVVIAVGKSNITTPVGADVPNVVGLSQTAATAAITGSLLQLGALTYQSSATVPVGEVISQSPAAGTAVVVGTPISLVISSPESVLYSFGPNNGATVEPYYLFQAPDGNLYGTTVGGSVLNNGTIFKVALNGTGSLLYSFSNPVTSGKYGPDGLLLDSATGTFFGVTSGGGRFGGGTLFQLTPGGTETVVYDFEGQIDNLGYYEGIDPAGLVLGPDGAFYGATAGGNGGSGTIFRIPTPGNGLGSVLYTFGLTSSVDGSNPAGNLLWDSKLGNFYGTTYHGGKNGTGTVYQISPSGVESVLYSFGTGSTDGQQPVGGLVLAPNGNFYGMTYYGGVNNTGTVYELTPAGVETVLYSFVAQIGSNPPTPTGGTLAVDSSGNIYGATEYGGTAGNGSVFRITPSGVYSTVYSFSPGVNDASLPHQVIVGADGNLYGTAFLGGVNNTGAIFKIRL